jgi:hypothetical protein
MERERIAFAIELQIIVTRKKKNIISMSHIKGEKTLKSSLH